MRVFCFCNRDMPTAPCGGGGGVTYRLMIANERHRMIDNMYFIFTNVIIEQETGMRYAIGDGTATYHSISDLQNVYRQLDQWLHFDGEDVFLFHDLGCFFAMSQAVQPQGTSIVIYHGQGGLFNELLIFGKNPNEADRESCRLITEYALIRADYFCFPSIGAKDAFRETSEESTRELLEKTDIRILYNGCSPIPPDGETVVDSVVNFLEDVTGRIFISVATINEAKGVERLPAFFETYGKFDTDYFWIVIGDGAMADRLEENSQDLAGHFLWLRDPLPNAAILRLYRHTDYYIMAHRFSIFDFATIEAMCMGNVPVLTPVGGNKEMIVEDNGYFLTEDLDGKAFYQWSMKQNLDHMKQENIRIANERFSEKSMLQGYRDLIGLRQR